MDVLGEAFASWHELPCGILAYPFLSPIELVICLDRDAPCVKRFCLLHPERNTDPVQYIAKASHVVPKSPFRQRKRNYMIG